MRIRINKKMYLIAVACCVVAGCTQLSGLSDYSKSDEIFDRGTDDSSSKGNGTDGTGSEPAVCEPGCDDAMRGNGSCDPACKNMACSFDDGDCDDEYCVDGCLIGTIDDGVCNGPCDIAVCDFDGGDCGGGDMGCAPGCQQSMIDDGICDYQCIGAGCGNDGGDCDDDAECMPGCQNVLLGNGQCNEACNNEWCFMDNGDCNMGEGCDPGASSCLYDCVPCARVNTCSESVRICHENSQCRFLQDCISVDCENMEFDIPKKNCMDNCFDTYPGGVIDFEMMRECLYCHACPESCSAEFGDFCDSFSM